MRECVEGVRGSVIIRMVLVCRTVGKGMREGRVELGATDLRSEIWTVMPRARPMVATRFPGGGVVSLS
jgi:hypothetical protein